MQNRGNLVIIAIVAIGLLAASLSLVYHRQSGRRALALWGTETALLIARAPQVQVLELAPADAVEPAAVDAESGGGQPIQRLGIGGRFYNVAAAKDAVEARGMSNIRSAMVRDASFDWEATDKAEASPTWQYGMEFTESGHRALVLFDFNTGRIGSTTSEQTAALQPEAVADWRKFFEEQWDTAKSNSRMGRSRHSASSPISPRLCRGTTGNFRAWSKWKPSLASTNRFPRQSRGLIVSDAVGRDLATAIARRRGRVGRF